MFISGCNIVKIVEALKDFSELNFILFKMCYIANQIKIPTVQF